MFPLLIETKPKYYLGHGRDYIFLFYLHSVKIHVRAA